MGGPVPLAYRVEHRRLVVDAAAATVRRVFEGFAELGSATRLLPVLRAEGLVTKTGRPFDKGAVYKLLVNRTYLGEAVHKGQSCPGEQQRIVRLLVERVTVTDAGAEIRLNLEGLAGLARDMAANQPREAMAA